MNYAELLQTALDAARAADPIIRRYFVDGAAVEYKADNSPVTEADVAAERAIRDTIEARFPDHGYFGEETGQSRAEASVTWLVDPIDGTKGFVRGYPMFSTQIAVMEAGELVVGVSHAPLFDETCWAVKGEGAWFNGEPVRVSGVDDLSRAQISFGNVRTLARSPTAWRALADIVQVAERTRGYGDFYHYHLLASGRIDAVIESDVNILDIAAVALIVNEAGGVFTDGDGRAVGMDTTSVLAANAALHGGLLARLHGDERAADTTHP